MFEQRAIEQSEERCVWRVFSLICLLSTLTGLLFLHMGTPPFNTRFFYLKTSTQQLMFEQWGIEQSRGEMRRMRFCHTFSLLGKAVHK